MAEISSMKKLEPGDKIDRVSDNEVIYTMVVLQVTDTRAYADIPGGSEPYEFQREYDGRCIRSVRPEAEGYVIRHAQ